MAIVNTANENEKQEISDIIDNMRLLDDTLMTMVFDGNIPATQRMINIILERSDIAVKSVTVQKVEINPLVGGYDVKLDIFAEDVHGNHYNFEIQRANEGAGKKRARFLSAALDQRMLKHGEKFDTIKDSYVIFITEHDVFKRGLPLYHIDRKFREYDDWFNDGNHIIYANASYPDTSTDIGRLMHDFREKDPDLMYIPELRDGISHFKRIGKGRDNMSEQLEAFVEKKSKNSAIGAAIQTCHDINPTMTDSQIRDYLMKTFDLSKDEADVYFSPVPA